MTDFNITLKSPTGEVTTITCPDDTYILDAADEAGVDLNYSCRAGACSSSVSYTHLTLPTNREV